MSWLIRLYPPAWRRRYGAELAELLSTQPLSFRTAIDLIAGAVDAWFNPQPSTAVMAADPEGGGSMIPKMLQLRMFEGQKYTATDSLKAATVTIVGSLLVVLGIMLAKMRYGESELLESLAVTLWLVPFLMGMGLTELKGHSRLVKAVFIGIPSAFVIGVALVNA